jgi:hypothetical protein
MAQTFTVEQIRKYIESQDSMGDALYNLSEKSVLEANEAIDTESEAYKEGYEEYPFKARLRNPYQHDCIEYKQYAAGWHAASNDDDDDETY